MCEQARKAVEDVKAGRLTNHEELKNVSPDENRMDKRSTPKPN